MSTILKYNLPVKIIKKIYPENFDEEDKRFLTCNRAGEISEHLKSGKIPSICNSMAKKEDLLDARSLNMLNDIFPPKIEEGKNEKYVTTIRETQATVMELKTLAEEIKMELLQRAARRMPLCHVRKDVLDNSIKELLRQLIVDCPERAQLFMKIIAEFDKYCDTYEILFHFNYAFMCRKFLKAKHISAEQIKKIVELEESKRILETQVALLKSTAEQSERRNSDLRCKGEMFRQKELKYYRTLGEQLKAQLDTSVVPAKEC